MDFLVDNKFWIVVVVVAYTIGRWPQFYSMIWSKFVGLFKKS